MEEQSKVPRCHSKQSVMPKQECIITQIFYNLPNIMELAPRVKNTFFSFDPYNYVIVVKNP